MGPDRIRGRKHFLKLTGTLAYDYAVCANVQSPRAGLLTFEHMGCRCFLWVAPKAAALV